MLCMFEQFSFNKGLNPLLCRADLGSVSISSIVQPVLVLLLDFQAP